jgi:hypothetical protein
VRWTRSVQIKLTCAFLNTVTTSLTCGSRLRFEAAAGFA